LKHSKFWATVDNDDDDVVFAVNLLCWRVMASQGKKKMECNVMDFERFRTQLIDEWMSVVIRHAHDTTKNGLFFSAFHFLRF
jgi:hypothetical protein